MLFEDAFLRPFYSLARYIQDGGEMVKKFVREVSLILGHKHNTTSMNLRECPRNAST